MMGLPISFAISLVESGWVLCILDEYGELEHSIHCSSNEELLLILGRESDRYRNKMESRYSSKYLKKPKLSISFDKPLSNFDGAVLVVDDSQGDHDPDIKSRKKKRK